MKKLISIVLLIIFYTAKAGIDMPKIHSTIMLDAKTYSGENSNEGNYKTQNRFQIRKAAIELTGNLEKDISYGIEFGLSTCAGGGDQLKLMEAKILYKMSENINFGIQQGHVLRGFAAKMDCYNRLTIEKPNFATTFAPCHPFGFVVNGFFPLGKKMSLESQLSLANGDNSTLDDEHDYNFGMIFNTPITGLSLLGSYNHTEKSYFDNNGNTFSKDGYRMVTGINYEKSNLWLTGEYYTGKGFSKDEQEMNAWYAQTGYSFKTNFSKLQSIRPYVKYEFWDKDSENDNDSEYTTLQSGIDFKISPYTQVRFAYTKEMDAPTDKENSDSIILRLQTGF